MYAALWRLLPGPSVVRVIICLVLVALVLVACDSWVFPWMADQLPMDEADFA